MTDALIVLNDLVVLPLMVGAVALCFLKGRRRVGWIGIAVLGVGSVVALPIFRALRDHDAEGWLMLPFLVGLGVLAVVGREALRPPLSDSWWARRHSGTHSGPLAH